MSLRNGRFWANRVAACLLAALARQESALARQEFHFRAPYRGTRTLADLILDRLVHNSYRASVLGRALVRLGMHAEIRGPRLVEHVIAAAIHRPRTKPAAGERSVRAVYGSIEPFIASAGIASAEPIPLIKEVPDVPNLVVVPTEVFGLTEIDPISLVVTDEELASAGSAPAVLQVSSTPALIVDDDFQQCPNATFTSIQLAVAAAAPGDTIRVCPGTYTP